MIALVVPQPSQWLPSLLAELRDLGELRVFAPWALAPAPAPWLPRRLRDFWHRRALETTSAETRSLQPLWLGVDGATKLFARDRTDRVMKARFATRRTVDALAARWLPAHTRLVLAPSLCARRVFAEAARRQIPRVLVEDLPGFRQLHEDLDRAAHRLPAFAFLRRYRAPAAAVAHQEAERVLADRLLVRGHFAETARRALGFRDNQVLVLPLHDDGPPARTPADRSAGTAAATGCARRRIPRRFPSPPALASP